MSKIIFITSNDETFEVDADAGSSVMEAALDNLVPGIDGDCGGMAACGTCLVHVEGDFVEKVGEPTTDLEKDMLSLTDAVTATSRLACQITMTDELDGLRLRLPEGQH